MSVIEPLATHAINDMQPSVSLYAPRQVILDERSLQKEGQGYGSESGGRSREVSDDAGGQDGSA
jgi:hypothetical protein